MKSIFFICAALLLLSQSNSARAACNIIPSTPSIGPVDSFTLNSAPQGGGWFFKLKLANPSDADDLMDEAAYKELVG